MTGGIERKTRMPILTSRQHRPVVLRGALLIAVLGGALMLGPATLAVADPERDLRVASRALTFLDHRPSGDMSVAVIYAPDSAASEADARALADAMASGSPRDRLRLIPSLLPATELGPLNNHEAVILAADLGDHAEPVFKAASQRGLVTISRDMDCVDAGHCVMAVASEPRVQITVSRRAASQSNVRFAPAFRMMITER